MNLTNSQRKKSPQLFDQSKHESKLCHQISFHQIKSKMAAIDMSNIHVSPNVISTLMPLQQESLRNLQQQILASPEAVIRSCSVEKLL